MENKRFYPSQQLVCMLNSKVLKVFMWLCGWSSQGEIRLYVNQMSKYLKLCESDIEICIQTLLDAKLITIRRENKTCFARINTEQAEKYFKIPMSEIAEMNVIKVSTDVKWNTEDIEVDGIEDMSEHELKQLLRRIQVSLNEREQMKKCVVTNDTKEINDLPF